ncbi:MAG TPA: DUF5709 domain-containing protein [Motilibacteraceae bacterium]|nr:DUF5709 domain-containing protein [Motilibacteraceae bacterium]
MTDSRNDTRTPQDIDDVGLSEAEPTVFDDRPSAQAFPDVVDDYDPERRDTPEPEQVALPSDVGYPGSSSVGTTVEEQIEGEDLDRKLAREQQDFTVDPADEPLPGQERHPDLAEDDLVEGIAGPSDDVYGRRPGALVAPDEGAHEDREADEIALETDAEALSPEEQAMHLEPEPED